jgi:triphosphatase
VAALSASKVKVIRRNFGIRSSFGHKKLNDSSGIAIATQSFPPQSESSGRWPGKMRIAWRIAAKYYLLTKNIGDSSPQFPGSAKKRKNSVMAQEIELKFIVADSGVETLRQHLNALKAKHTPAGQLLNIYYETADNWLRRHDMGLRIRGDRGAMK